MNRRDFTKKTIMASALIASTSGTVFPRLPKQTKRTLKRGIMWGGVQVGNTVLEKFQAVKAAGFDGIEVDSHLDRKEVLSARDRTGLIISSVCDSKHWEFLLSSPDAEVRKKGVDALIVSLEDAKAYGGDAVLLVPGRVTQDISYDQCWDRSTAEIKKAIPVAEKFGVKIAVENVWNGFLLSPLEAARYIDQFGSTAMASYFDIGNIVAFGWPEQWIRILGKRIAKFHVKEYSRKLRDTRGMGAGFDVKLREGDVNWPAVMKAIDEIGYKGWMTIEMDGGNSPEGLKDLCDRLDLIIER
jgi:L-ribulose-5-phosphate 3-epimerase